MTIKSAQLLKRLDPAVRPNIAPARGGAGGMRPAFEAQSFDQLLSLASKGAVHSGRQIELGFDPSPPLDSSQLERLAAAADRAQAAGAKHALMMIDGRGFVLDVESRTLTSELSHDSTSSIVNIDAAVFVAADDEALSGDALSPPSALMPQAVAKQLAALKPTGNCQLTTSN
jgi:hypothetical protein